MKVGEGAVLKATAGSKDTGSEGPKVTRSRMLDEQIIWNGSVAVLCNQQDHS